MFFVRSPHHKHFGKAQHLVLWALWWHQSFFTRWPEPHWWVLRGTKRVYKKVIYIYIYIYIYICLITKLPEYICTPFPAYPFTPKKLDNKSWEGISLSYDHMEMSIFKKVDYRRDIVVLLFLSLYILAALFLTEILSCIHLLEVIICFWHCNIKKKN